MSLELYRQIILGMNGVQQGLRLYPPGHPSIKQLVRNALEALRQLFRSKRLITVGVHEDVLFVEEHLFVQPSAAFTEIRQLLFDRGVSKLEFSPEITEQELLDFLVVLREGKKRGPDLRQFVSQSNMLGLRVVTEELEEEEPRNPKEVYSHAIEVVKEMFQDVRLGKIPSKTNADGLVTDMVELTLAQPHALFALSMIKDYDNYTFTHSVNVAVLALSVGRACSVPEKGLRYLALGGLLHDVGKLKVDVGIINKPGRLTPDEFEQIRLHPLSGAQIVRQMEGITQEVVDIVHYHHLLYNQSGYPQDGLNRKLSPFVDMASIADSYDAMTTLRAYQRPISPRQAVTRMKELAGITLHPQYLERFIQSLGTYPVGSVIRLDGNEIGLVVGVDADNPRDLQVKVLMDSNGSPLPRPDLLALKGSQTSRIVAEVDPFVKRINVADHLEF